MNVILTALQEVYGLFVEDGSYAAAIVVWLLVIGFLSPYAAASLRAPLLVIGLVCILIENVVRTAKHS